MSELRNLPSVEYLIEQPIIQRLIKEFGRILVLNLIRKELSKVRSIYKEKGTLLSTPSIINEIHNQLKSIHSSGFQTVINATGVILHTNLGRAPLCEDAVSAINKIASGYNNLEFDLEKGERGSRTVSLERMLTVLTGAGSAFVVGNNAAAVLLILTALAKNKRVLIGRSQLVEIGGGFRIPDVMKASGARLIEVGTTNKVHLEDYENSLSEPAAMVLRAHHSNFRIIGFTSEPGIKELAEVAHKHDVLFVDDLGSGAFLETSKYGLLHEPMVQESLAAGADLVCFSGDKLLGGPQAGIILGRKDIISKLRKHPLARAVRADKLCLAGLAATVSHYLKQDAEETIPTWQMISMKPPAIRKKAERWQKAIGKGKVIKGQSTVGGGSLPEETLPTYLLALEGNNPDHLISRLRNLPMPIIGRIENGLLVFDPRTVLEVQENDFCEGVKKILAQEND